jgi:hypothetical protein
VRAQTLELKISRQENDDMEILISIIWLGIGWLSTYAIDARISMPRWNCFPLGPGEKAVITLLWPVAWVMTWITDRETKQGE